LIDFKHIDEHYQGAERNMWHIYKVIMSNTRLFNKNTHFCCFLLYLLRKWTDLHKNCARRRRSHAVTYV